MDRAPRRCELDLGPISFHAAPVHDAPSRMAAVEKESMVLRRILIAFVLCLASAASAEGGAPAEPGAPWRVVLIRSWDSLFTANIVRERALREKITQDAPREVEFYPEEIDPLRFAGAIEGDFVSLLQRKYRDTQVDVV